MSKKTEKELAKLKSDAKKIEEKADRILKGLHEGLKDIYARSDALAKEIAKNRKK